MKHSFEKYAPFKQIDLPNRSWPGRSIRKAPIWCNVDLRDGNQALVDPMNLQEKLALFKTLVDMGFKEIEIGFPSASETEYEITRTLIEGGHIPDDVWIQVLVQARPHLIKKTFEAVAGAKNVIFHFYNSTSTIQRKVVFKSDMDGVIEIAVSAARLIRELAEDFDGNIRFEYSPESFSGTEPENAVAICSRVLDALRATPENKVILNLPSTVEMCTPNTFADQVEYVCRNLPGRDRAIISVHPHNDRGTGVACAELALLAGAERLEGTLFGNGERTGNLDLMTVALNMFTQGIAPGLDVSNISGLREVYERSTRMRIHERHPYVGDLVFTAFSGSHQDAISKGIAYMRDHGSDYWEIPYLPISPEDIGRSYDPIIRINSQSGKGGAAFIMQTVFGYHIPKAMHAEFGAIVKAECDRLGREIRAEEIMDIFSREYLNVKTPYLLKRHKLEQESGSNGDAAVSFRGVVEAFGRDHEVSGSGNGPIDAFFRALRAVGIDNYEFINYSEHAISHGSESKAVAYIELRAPDGAPAFGVGTSGNINIASIRGVLNAINRSSSRK